MDPDRWPCPTIRRCASAPVSRQAEVPGPSKPAGWPSYSGGLPAKHRRNVDDDLRARVVDDGVPIDDSASILRRKHDQLPLDDDRKWLDLLLPSGREPTGSIVLLGQPRRQVSVLRFVVLGNQPDITGLE